MAKVITIVCTNCPLGCRVSVEREADGSFKVSGNKCQRGYDFAVEEMTDPKRVLTTSVKVVDGEIPLVSVRTFPRIPKRLIPAAMEKIRKLRVRAPVRVGDVLVKDLLGTGAKLLATRTVAKAKKKE